MTSCGRLLRPVLASLRQTDCQPDPRPNNARQISRFQFKSMAHSVGHTQASIQASIVSSADRAGSNDV